MQLVSNLGLDPITEFGVDTPGGNKDKRFVDVVGVDRDTGRPAIFVQVGRVNQDGTIVSRERKAISDLWEQSSYEGEVLITFLTYYPSGA